MAFILAFASCEKEEILPVDHLNDSFFSDCDGEDPDQTRGDDGSIIIYDGDGNIVDPDEDDDDMGDKDDNIVDPDEDDDDMGDDENIVDPDEDDEDLNEDEEGK